MDLNDHITFVWTGQRRDSGKGSFFGVFVMNGILPVPHYSLDTNRYTSLCYIFNGKFGKSIFIEESIFSYEVIEMIRAKSKNYKAIEHEHLLRKFNDIIIDSFKQELTIIKLKK